MKIITTVGTSLIENAKLSDSFKELENKTYFKYITRYDKEDIENFVNKLISALEKDIDCAEIKTIEKIVERYKLEYYEIYLISTDTLKSFIISEALKKFYQKKGIKVKFEKDYIIRHLSIFENSLDLVRRGYKNLIKILMQETTGYNEIYNISGGYKAIIPYMSIVAQIYGLPAYYIFQESDDQRFELIRIHNIPITINEQLFFISLSIFSLINDTYTNK
jgi:putative CRISPR-associated protein (TIGR02619 family)